MNVGLVKESISHKKNPVAATVLWMLFGLFGVHQFYIGDLDKGATLLMLTVVGCSLLLGGGSIVSTVLGTGALVASAILWLDDAVPEVVP